MIAATTWTWMRCMGSSLAPAACVPLGRSCSAPSHWDERAREEHGSPRKLSSFTNLAI